VPGRLALWEKNEAVQVEVDGVGVGVGVGVEIVGST